MTKLTTPENDPTSPQAQSNVSIRSYKAEDFKAVREMYVEGLLAYCPSGQNAGLRAYVEHSLHEDMADIEGTYFGSGGHFWVAVVSDDTAGDQIVGSIAIEVKDDRRGEIRRLSVREAYRRHGLARKLVSHLESWARHHGISSIFLCTSTIMTNAIKLYEALGYTHTNTAVINHDPYEEIWTYETSLEPLDA